MHLSNLFKQNMLCEIWNTLKKICIEVRLASMMRARSRLTLWDPMRLNVPRAF